MRVSRFLLCALLLTSGLARGAFAQAPSVPANVAATGTTGSLTISWSASTNAVSYKLYRSTTSGGEGSTPVVTGITATSYTNSGLTNGTKYYFKVSAVNSGSTESAQSSEVSGTPIAAITTLTARAGYGQVQLDWSSASGASFYRIYRGTSSNGEGSTPIANSSGISYTDSGLTNGTTYYYQVSGVNGWFSAPAAEGTRSSEASATPQSTLLAAPTGLIALVGNAQTILSWNAVTGATGYSVKRSLYTGGAYTTVASSVTATTYTNTGLTNGTTYYYVVTATKTGSESANSNEVVVVPSSTSSSATNILTPVADSYVKQSATTTNYGLDGVLYVRNGSSSNTMISYLKFDLSSASGSVTSAKVRIYGSAGYAGNDSISSVSNTTWTETGLTWSNKPTIGSSLASTSIGTTQQWYEWDITSYIQAQQAAGTSLVSLSLTTDTSAPSNAFNTYTPREGGSNHPQLVLVVGGPVAPTLSATTGIGQVNLSWTASPGATSYTVKRSTTSGSGFATVSGGSAVTGTSFVDTAPYNGITSYYIVYANNANGAGPNSNQASVSMPTVAPTGIVVTPGEQQNLITWTAVPGAISYNVYQSTTSGSYSTAINNKRILGNAYLDTALTNGTTYYYKVTAVYPSTSESSKSSEGSAAPLAQDSNWSVAVSSTNAANPTTSTNTQLGAFATSHKTTLMVSASASGSTTSSISTQSQASYTGTWTFTWSGTSWPTLYVVKHLLQKMYFTTVNNGTGTPSVANTGGSTLISSAYPVTDTELMSVSSPNSTMDTSDLTQVNWTTGMTTQMKHAFTSDGTSTGTVTGWNSNQKIMSVDTKAYTSQWFQNHFASPSAVQLTFTVTGSNITVSADLASSGSSGSSAAQAMASDMFSGF